MFESFFAEGGISLDRLRSFALVAEKGGIARVVEGDPSRASLISRQIRELETFFGTELTRRKGKGIVLTASGRELARQIRLQFHGLADFRSSCAEKPVEARIAAGNSVIEWLLVPGMAKLMKRCPNCSYSLFDMRTAETVTALLDHTVDFGIIRRSAVVTPLKYHALGSFGYRLYVPAGLAKLSEEELPLALAMGGEFSRQFHRAAATAKKEPKVVFQCTSFTQAAQLARVGVAAAVLPEIGRVAVRNAIETRPIPWLKNFRRELGVTWHPRLLEARPGLNAILEGLRGFRAG